MWGEIACHVPNLCGWSYRLCIGAATTGIIDALVGAGPTLCRFWAFILWDSFTILCAFEDSRSFIGGSDFAHCIQVSLTGTTVEPFWVHWSVVGDSFGHV